MGEFHDAVSTLLEAFGRGIEIIKSQRARRKREQLPLEPMKNRAETHLSKSLKRNRVDVKNAYGRDLARHGPGFANGDELLIVDLNFPFINYSSSALSSTEMPSIGATLVVGMIHVEPGHRLSTLTGNSKADFMLAEAQSSLSAILFRLNAGFVSVIERFTRGRSTSTDYQALLNLSHASRMEAITTFEQLSQRLSRSSLALVPSGTNKAHAKHRTHHRRRNASSPAGHGTHSRSKGAPDLSLTPLGPANTDGWVRPKTGRKLSSESKPSTTPGSSTPRRPSSKTQSQHPPSSTERTSPTSSTRVVPRLRETPPGYTTTTDHRNSIRSFATDSTKLGEIPEHKWARQMKLDAGQFPVRKYYPLEAYQEPEKQKSRFMRFFRRRMD